MKKFLFSAATAVALIAAAPASAQLGVLQSVIEDAFGGGLGSRINRLDDRIERAFARGEISRSQADRLFEELVDLRRLADDFRSGGLNRGERLELERRIRMLESRIDRARFDRDDRDDRDDRFGRDRLDRDDRGARQGWCPPGLRKKNPDCMPPGQYKKRGERFERGSSRYDYDRGYRDDDRFTYREDRDGRILQIDRRTGRIVRVIEPRR